MSDLSKTISLIHGYTDQSWELTTDLPTEERQGVILVQFHEGTEEQAVEELHRAIETMLEARFG